MPAASGASPSMDARQPSTSQGMNRFDVRSQTEGPRDLDCVDLSTHIVRADTAFRKHSRWKERQVWSIEDIAGLGIPQEDKAKLLGGNLKKVFHID